VPSHVHFADARIEYVDADGRLDRLDIEVVTLHYRGAHGAAASRLRGQSAAALLPAIPHPVTTTEVRGLEIRQRPFHVDQPARGGLQKNTQCARDGKPLFTRHPDAQFFIHQ
jgi:hypothetical protein